MSLNCSNPPWRCCSISLKGLLPNTCSFGNRPMSLREGRSLCRKCCREGRANAVSKRKWRLSSSSTFAGTSKHTKHSKAMPIFSFRSSSIEFTTLKRSHICKHYRSQAKTQKGNALRMEANLRRNSIQNRVYPR